MALGWGDASLGVATHGVSPSLVWKAKFMVDDRRILVLLLEGDSYRDVVEMVGCSYRDVARVKQAITEHGVIWWGGSLMGAVGCRMSTTSLILSGCWCR